MREDAARTPRKSLRTRAIAGGIVSCLGILFLALGLFANLGNELILVAIGAATTFVGVSVLAPLAAKPLADVIGWPLPRLFGFIDAKLASILRG